MKGFVLVCCILTSLSLAQNTSAQQSCNEAWKQHITENFWLLDLGEYQSCLLIQNHWLAEIISDESGVKIYHYEFIRTENYFDRVIVLFHQDSLTKNPAIAIVVTWKLDNTVNQQKTEKGTLIIRSLVGEAFVSEPFLLTKRGNESNDAYHIVPPGPLFEVKQEALQLLRTVWARK